MTKMYSNSSVIGNGLLSVTSYWFLIEHDLVFLIHCFLLWNHNSTRDLSSSAEKRPSSGRWSCLGFTATCKVKIQLQDPMSNIVYRLITYIHNPLGATRPLKVRANP